MDVEVDQREPFRRSAWVHPSGYVALPDVHDGLWYVASVLSLYLPEKEDDFLLEAVDGREVVAFAVERGADPVEGLWVPSAPYIFNAWPTFFQLSREYGGGSHGLPEWADRAPFIALEELTLRRRTDWIAAIQSDRRVSFRLGLVLGYVYETVREYIKRILAGLMRSKRIFMALRAALLPRLRRSECSSHFQRLT